MLISLTEPLQPLVIPPHLALEVDCREILAAFHAPVTQATGFLKGFVVLLSDRDLDVVVVYSAGPGPGVATMDVERVLARRSDRAAGCPDLLIFTMSDPVVTAALHTRIRVTVRNAGSVGASNVELQLEDQSRTTADRIVTTTIPYIAGNDQIDVILELPYELTPARRSSVLVTVDPKELIAECDESNNQRRLSPA